MLRHRTKLVSFPGFQGAKFVCIRQVFIIYPLEDNLDFNLEALPKTIMLNDGSLERFLGRFIKDAAMEIVSTTALTEDLLANFKVLQKRRKKITSSTRWKFQSLMVMIQQLRQFPILYLKGSG
jgi:hypothetical protein